MRLDKYLKVSRLIKRRTVAKKLLIKAVFQYGKYKSSSDVSTMMSLRCDLEIKL